MNVLLTRLALLIALLIACSASVAPATAAVAGDLSYTDLGSTIRIDGCATATCPAAITIPATLSGKPVTTLQVAAFYNKTTLTSVAFTTPSNLTSISNTAFRNTRLTSIAIPQGVTSVGDEAFLDVTTLASASLPASLTTMGASAFAHTSGLQTVTFAEPSSLTALPSRAFEGSGITTIAVPDSVTAIGDYAFTVCPDLAAAILGRGTATIGTGAFMSSPSLTSVTFPANGSLTSIGGSAFYATGLVSLRIPDSVTSMGTWAFASTSALNDVTIGRGLVEIPQLAFYQSGIRSISFDSPSAVTTINNQAFTSTGNLETITIPSSVSTIGPDAFWLASGLRSVTFAWPSSVTSLGFKTFRDASNLTTVDFFGNAPTVAAGAFSGTASSLRVRYLTATTGWSSSLDSITTALAPPWTPATPTATGGDGSATVTTAVAYPSNAPTDITVTAAPGGRSCRIEGGSGTCTVAGLANGTTYTFTAVAANGTGTSGTSAPSAPVVPAAPTTAPAATTSTLRVARPQASGRAVTTIVTVAGPGLIRQTATRLTSGRRATTTICTAERRTKGAGRITIVCLFDRGVRAELRRHPIRVRLTTRFTPARGKTASSTTTITIPRSR